MDHIMEQRLLSDKMRRRLEEVDDAAQQQLAPIQHHVQLTFQRAYFKCAHECFDRMRRQEELNNCLEHCHAPLLDADNVIETEVVKFHERLNLSLMICESKYEAAILDQMKPGAMNDLESCVNQAIDDSISALPHVVARIENALSIIN